MSIRTAVRALDSGYRGCATSGRSLLPSPVHSSVFCSFRLLTSLLSLTGLRAACVFFPFSPPLPTISDPDISLPNITATQGHSVISPTSGSPPTTPLSPWDPASLCFCTFYPFAPSSLETLPKYRHINATFPSCHRRRSLVFHCAPTPRGQPLPNVTLVHCPYSSLPPLPGSFLVGDAAWLLFSALERSPGTERRQMFLKMSKWKIIGIG